MTAIFYEIIFCLIVEDHMRNLLLSLGHKLTQLTTIPEWKLTLLATFSGRKLADHKLTLLAAIAVASEKARSLAKSVLFKKKKKLSSLSFDYFNRIQAEVLHKKQVALGHCLT